MVAGLQLRGLSEKTQESYVRAVRQLAEHQGKSPDGIGEEELRQYLLYLKNDEQVSPSAFTIALCGIKFFYQHTLRREWTTFELVRPNREHSLPVVLSVDEVQRILGCLRLPRYRVCLSTIYTCGLRLQEWLAALGLHCQPAGNGFNALKYLAPYIFRVAISNRRILNVEDGRVPIRA
jgi:site-specific recombinase XerD